MTRQGSEIGLLHGLHASGCSGTEYSACRPVVVPSDDPSFSDWDRGSDLEVIIMTWCSDCGAADWDFV